MDYSPTLNEYPYRNRDLDRILDETPHQIVTYLLHFPCAIRLRQHYIGSTRTDTFHARMRAHATGYGASFTRALLARNKLFHVVKIWLTDDRDFERRLKIRAHYRDHCAICRNAGDHPQLLTVPTAFSLTRARNATALGKQTSFAYRESRTNPRTIEEEEARQAPYRPQSPF